MPRSICSAAAKEEKKKMDFLISKSASHVSSSLQSDLASLCNNIQREDNCWVHAHGLALIFKTGHGTAEMRPVSLMAVVQADYLQWDRSGNGVVLSGGNAEEDNYVLIFFFFCKRGSRGMTPARSLKSNHHHTLVEFRLMR